jgi:hypothetical protein
MNVGYPPIARKGIPALARDRLSHVAQTAREEQWNEKPW